MPSRFFSRLRASKSRDKKQEAAPAYSTLYFANFNDVACPPPYEERDPAVSRNPEVRPSTLIRTASDSSYTPEELFSWNDVPDDAAQGSGLEELPPYQERPLLPMFVSVRSPGHAVTTGNRRAHIFMCPCARCRGLR